VINCREDHAQEGGELAQVYLHGKLLYTWVLEKIARRRCGETWNCLNQARSATWWRVWKLLRQELALMINGVLQWDFSQWQLCLDVMQERPRRRKLQTLPDRVKRLITYCQAMALSNI
jgi:hypothetical protein